MVNKLSTSPKSAIISITLATLLTACGGGDEEVNKEIDNIPTPTNPTNPNTNTDSNIPTGPNTTIKIQGIVDVKKITNVNIKDGNGLVLMSTKTDENGNFSFDYDSVKKMIADNKLNPSDVIEISSDNLKLAFNFPDSTDSDLKAQLNNTSDAVYNVVYGNGFNSNTVKEMNTLAKGTGIDTDGNLISTAKDLNNLLPNTVVPEQIGKVVNLRNLPEGKTIYFSYNDGVSLYQFSEVNGIEVMKGDTVKYFWFDNNQKYSLGSFRIDDSKL